MNTVVKLVPRIKIDKGIPIPVARKKVTPWPFMDMEIGDSFLVDEASMRAAASTAQDMKKQGYIFTRRKTRDGYRFWRVK